MKKLISHLLAIAMLVGLGMSSLYPDCGIIDSFDYERDVVIVRTCDGNTWEYQGIEDWSIGDMCGIMFSNNNTPLSIYDDIIVQLKYAMRIENFYPTFEEEIIEELIPEEFIPEELFEYEELIF